MSACIPLTLDQAKLIMSNLKGRQSIRNKAIFSLGCATGMRISELLCLQIGDIIQPDGEFRKKIKLTDFMYKRLSSYYHTKSVIQDNSKSTKKHSGEIGVRSFCHKYISSLINQLYYNGYQQPNNFLFVTSTGKIVRRQSIYWAIRCSAEASGIFQTVGTHSMRKSFAMDLYFLIEKASKTNLKIKPMILMKSALRHAKYDSTLSYMKFIDTNIDPFFEEKSFEL